MKKYKLIGICGEAGTGKDRLVTELTNFNENFHEVITATSRPMRDNEKDGINYYFISKEKFKQDIKNNKFLEYVIFNHWYYGTPISSLDINKINIGVFNPAGLETLIKNPCIDLHIIKLTAENINRIMRQIIREKSPNIKEIARRYIADKEDFQHIWETLNIEVELVNDTLDDLCANIEYINQKYYCCC